MNAMTLSAVVRRLRLAKGLTQAQLAERIQVSPKTVSKWETGKGLPDISTIDPLAAALGVSVSELMAGDVVTNKNCSANMLRTKFYVCPHCGNILHAAGEALIGCCGELLRPLEASEADEMHAAELEAVEDETYVTFTHPMSKKHYLSFVAYVTADRVQLVKLYPEGAAACRLSLRGFGMLYYYCSLHGLFKMRPGREHK